MLHQMGTQRIEVVVRKETSGSADTGTKEKDTTDAGSGKDITWRTAVFGSESPQRIKRVIKTNMTHTLAIAKQVIDLGIEHFVSGIGNMTGDQALQDKISRKVEKVTDTTNFASSIGMGALYGAWGGPVGAVLGMTFGALQTGVSISAKYAKREREYNYKVFKENNAIEYNRARAGINLTAGRLR